MKAHLPLCVSLLLASSFLPASAQVLAAFAYDQAINNTGALGETFTEISTTSAQLNGITLAVSNSINFQDRDGGTNNVDDSGNITPFQGVVFSNGTPGNPATYMDFTIGGLTSGDSYEIVVYSGDGAGGTGSEPTDITLGGVTAELNAPDTSTSFIPAGSAGANYIEEIVTADSADEITFTAAPDAAGDGYDFVDAVTIAEVPEPSISLMLGVSGVGLLLLHRRFSVRQV